MPHQLLNDNAGNGFRKVSWKQGLRKERVWKRGGPILAPVKMQEHSKTVFSIFVCCLFSIKVELHKVCYSWASPCAS